MNATAEKTRKATWLDDAKTLRLMKAAHEQACRELDQMPRHMLDRGNPNHPDYDDKLFGYAVPDFMAKQYRAG